MARSKHSPEVRLKAVEDYFNGVRSVTILQEIYL